MISQHVTVVFYVDESFYGKYARSVGVTEHEVKKKGHLYIVLDCFGPGGEGPAMYQPHTCRVPYFCLVPCLSDAD